MDDITAKAWCDALRSGEYKQGKGVLRSKDNNFCCLGVLGDLSVKAGQKEWTKNSINTNWCLDNDYVILTNPDSLGLKAHSNSGKLPLHFFTSKYDTRQIPSKVELDTDSDLDKKWGLVTLAELNDSGFTFEQIADVIWYFREYL